MLTLSKKKVGGNVATQPAKYTVIVLVSHVTDKWPPPTPLPSPLLIRTSSLLALLPSPFPLIKPNNGLPLLLNSFNPISRPQYFPPLSQVTRALILHLHHQSLSLNYPPPLCVRSQSCSLFFQC